MNFGIGIFETDGVFSRGVKMQLLQCVLSSLMRKTKVCTFISTVIKVDFKCVIVCKLRPLPATTILLGESGILKSAIFSNGWRVQVNRCLARSCAFVCSCSECNDLIFDFMLIMRSKSCIFGSRKLHLPWATMQGRTCSPQNILHWGHYRYQNMTMSPYQQLFCDLWNLLRRSTQRPWRKIVRRQVAKAKRCWGAWYLSAKFWMRRERFGGADVWCGLLSTDRWSSLMPFKMPPVFGCLVVDMHILQSDLELQDGMSIENTRTKEIFRRGIFDQSVVRGSVFTSSSSSIICVEDCSQFFMPSFSLTWRSSAIIDGEIMKFITKIIP